MQHGFFYGGGGGCAGGGWVVGRAKKEITYHIPSSIKLITRQLVCQQIFSHGI